MATKPEGSVPPEAIFDWDFIASHAHYWLFIVLMMSGLFVVVARGNLVKKLIGLNIFQVAVFMLYISIGKVSGGTAPILPLKLTIDPTIQYSNPLPHVLILTAIVVGVATISLGLALVVRIREAFGTIEEDDLLVIERGMTEEENRRHGPYMGGRA
ncbi:MAG: cation:proton antiporter subunit C [Pseudomonadota bacterium]